MVSRPFVLRGNPSVDAQFSIPYVVVSALLDGYVFLDSFEPKKVEGRADHPLIKMVKVFNDREIRDPSSLGPVTVEIRIKSGETYSETVREFKGHPRNTLTEKEFLDKFIRCLSYSYKRFSREKLDEITKMVFQFETLKNTNNLIAML
jgi:2-methylcitrate dehydratase